VPGFKKRKGKSYKVEQYGNFKQNIKRRNKIRHVTTVAEINYAERIK
jgi:hypothetical protein